MSDIKFVETDALAIQNEMITEFEKALGETLYPGDERRIFLLQLTPVLVGLKNEINETGKQNLLRYAKGTNLEAKGDPISRLEERYAVTTLKWSLSAAQSITVTIQKGKRATLDGKLFFANDEDLVIPPGQLSGTVKAKATEPGTKYNGFAPGRINKIVDSTPFVAAVENIDTSSGGADVEDEESYRERIRLAPDSYSTAGPSGGYEFWAKTADPNIADVKSLSPSPGVVKLSILMKNGELPSQSVLDSVQAVLSPKNRRPQTDYVEAAAAIQDPYNIELIYYISSERKTEEAAIISAVEGADGAIEKYRLWQKSKQGRAINPDYLRQLMLNAGAYRINITSPVYTLVAQDHVAKDATVTITYGGLVDEA